MVALHLAGEFGNLIFLTIRLLFKRVLEVSLKNRVRKYLEHTLFCLNIGSFLNIHIIGSISAVLSKQC